MSVREVLGLPPVDPDVERRFGPPTYTEEQVLRYATLVAPQPLQGGEVTRLRTLVSEMGKPNNLSLFPAILVAYADSKKPRAEHLAEDIDAILALISPAQREGEG